MDKAKEGNLDDLAVGVLRCVRRLLELLERCVHTDALQKKDTATNTTGSETDSAGKGDLNESNTEDNPAEKPAVEGELRDVLQVMVGTLRRIVDDLKNDDKEKSPLPSLFDISITSSEKTLPAPENTPDDTNEEIGGNNNDNVDDEQQATEYESISQDEGIVEDKEENETPEIDTDEVQFQDEKSDDINGNTETWFENAEEMIPEDNNVEEQCSGEEAAEDAPSVDENADNVPPEDENAEDAPPEDENAEDAPPEDENAEEKTSEDTLTEEGGVEGEGGDNVELEDEEETCEPMDGEPLSEEGSGDHHPLIEEIDPPEMEELTDDNLLLDVDGEEEAGCTAGAQAAADPQDDIWQPDDCDRTGSETALPTEDTNATEDDDTADEGAQKDDLEPSDMEYDSFFPTEDEDVLPVAESTSDEDAPEVLGLKAVRMFRKHMEMDNVEVEMVPTPRDQPRRHFFYTCRVLGLEAEACGRSKRAAKRNAISKIIRIIIKKQKDGSLPSEVSPFSTDELASLAEACRGGADYLSRLRQLCRALHAPPPTYDVQSSQEAGGDKVFTVQCSALGRTAVGICARKRSAKRHAAREIVKRYEEEAAAAGAPVTITA